MDEDAFALRGNCLGDHPVAEASAIDQSHVEPGASQADCGDRAGGTGSDHGDNRITAAHGLRSVSNQRFLFAGSRRETNPCFDQFATISL